MRNLKLFILGLGFLILFACQEEHSEKTNNHNAALPHTMPAVRTELSKQDAQTLAQAKGKAVEQIRVADVEQMFDAAERKPHIFVFWKMDCTTCKMGLEHLHLALQKVPTEQYRFVMINLDDETKNTAVNTYIRSQNFFAETYQLKTAKGGWTDGIHPEWDGNLPAAFLVNADEGMNVKIGDFTDEQQIHALIKALK